MAQHRWNRRFFQEADAPPDNLVYFEPDRIRRRRFAERERDARRAEEIDRSGSQRHLERAAKRLKHVDAADRILYVPQWDMAKAELQYGDDPWAKELAQKIIAAQEAEIAQMRDWLSKQTP